MIFKDLCNNVSVFKQLKRQMKMNVKFMRIEAHQIYIDISNYYYKDTATNVFNDLQIPVGT